MPRFVHVKGIDGAFFSDTKNERDLSPEEVCKILNDHDGVMTRKEIEELLSKQIENCGATALQKVLGKSKEVK